MRGLLYCRQKGVPCLESLKVERRCDLDDAWGMAFRVWDDLTVKELWELGCLLVFSKELSILRYFGIHWELRNVCRCSRDCRVDVLRMGRIDSGVTWVKNRKKIWVVWLSAELFKTEVVFRLGNCSGEIMLRVFQQSLGPTYFGWCRDRILGWYCNTVLDWKVCDKNRQEMTKSLAKFRIIRL